MEEQNEFSSFDIVKNHQLFWYVNGIRGANPNWKPFRRDLYRCYQILIHTFISVYYPASLMIGLLQLTDIRSILENVAMNFTVSMCTLKSYLFWSNMEGFKQCENISRRMDEKAKDDAEGIAVLMALKKKIKFLLVPYFLTTIVSVSAVIIMQFFNTEKRLIYPAYFPFDWAKNDYIYIATMMYQGGGIALQAFMNLANDTYLSLTMCLLTCHINVLSVRMSKIGMNVNKSKEETHEDLKVAIKDHKELLK